MSLGENSLVAAYQGRGQLKSRPSGTRVVRDSHYTQISALCYAMLLLNYNNYCRQRYEKKGCLYLHVYPIDVCLGSVFRLSVFPSVILSSSYVYFILSSTLFFVSLSIILL